MKKVIDKKIKRIIYIICILIFLLFILICVLGNIKSKQSYNEQKENIKTYTSLNQFQTIEEVAIYLDCELKKKEQSKDENFKTDIYMKIPVKPYTEEKSNEDFYNNLIGYSAYVLEFNNFRIIDEENDINIQVIANIENEKIEKIIINGEENYFDKRDSELEIKNRKENRIVNLTVQSNIIQTLINNDWKITDSKIGSKESTFNLYNIYYEEGIEVRKINGRVFNIVFTENYKDNIVNNITTETSKEKIVQILGNPIFEDKLTNVIGYIGKDIYVFFNINNKQVSIYRNYEDNEMSFGEIYKNYKDEGKTKLQLINDLREKWNDYDYYKQTDNYTILKYTLKGLKVQYNTGDENGVIIYNNYPGKIYKDITLSNVSENVDEIPNDIYIKNQDLIFINEKERVQNIQSRIFMAQQQKEMENKQDQIDSKVFIEYKEKLEDGSYNIKFISLDGKNVNSELKESINSGLWINDTLYAYGVKNKGIYVYDVANRKYLTINSDGKSDYEIKEFKNKILKYDDKTIKLNV